MASEIHVNDVGTTFLITVKDGDAAVNLYENINARSVIFRKPSDTVVTKTGSVYDTGSGASGVMYYDALPDDLDEVGFWKLQGKIEFTGELGTFYTDIHTFQVHSNL